MIACRRSMIASVTFVLLVVACSSSRDDDAAGADSTTTVTTPSSTTTPVLTTTPVDTTTSVDTTTPIDATTTTDGGDPNGNGTDEIIDSVQWGPDSPPIPSEYKAWSPSESGELQCELSSEGPDDSEFWTLAEQICWALRGEGEWPSTDSVPSPPTAQSAYHACLDNELTSFLDTVLAWHASHPGQTPALNVPSAGDHSSCQRSLFDVAVAVETEEERCELNPPWFEITMIAPGDPVPDPSVTVDGLDGATFCPDDDDDNGYREVSVAVHESATGSTVTVNVATAYGLLSTTVELPVLPDDGDESATTSSDPNSSTTVTDESS